jgi:hypothetical protein
VSSDTTEEEEERKEEEAKDAMAEEAEFGIPRKDDLELLQLMDLLVLCDRYCIHDKHLYAQCWSKLLKHVTVWNVATTWQFAAQLTSSLEKVHTCCFC